MLKYGLMTGIMVAFLATLSGCVLPPEGAEESGGFDWTLIIFVVLLVAIFYFLIIRPQRRQQKKHQELMQEMKRGDKVVTTGGIFGVVESLSDDSVVLKIESGATIRVARSSIAGQRQEQ
ncbi:MAG: preprotein translocase subunit YajC [Dehalococcoidales bacterium]